MEEACAGAARGGHLAALEWLDKRVASRRELRKVCVKAARGGHLAVIKWARDRGYPWGRLTCPAAAKGGHLDALKWCLENRAPWQWRAFRYAAKRADMEMLSWLWERRQTNWRVANQRALADALGCAAKEGHLPVVEWLVEKGTDATTSVCRFAASGGQLHVLEWAKARGMPWDDSAYCDAAGGGHLDTLRWLTSNGASCDDDTMWVSAVEGDHSHFDVVMWAIDEGVPLPRPHIMRDRLRWAEAGIRDVEAARGRMTASGRRWLRAMEESGVMERLYLLNDADGTPTSSDEDTEDSTGSEVLHTKEYAPPQKKRPAREGL